MDFKKFIQDGIKDIEIELTEEFDRNFERKAFFNESWPTNKIPNSRGSLLQRTGALRGSIQSRVTNGRLTYRSSEPYADIHNNGGEIEVTAKMKAYFWAMYFKADGAVTLKRAKDKSVVVRDTQRNKRLTAEAQMWKNLALMKLGTKMKIEQRQFIGHHAEVDQLIENVFNDNLQDLAKQITDQLKKP